ncbi:MAG: hypothetical protein ACXVAB_07165 [Thermodesulfobacteriota bacterium]
MAQIIFGRKSIVVSLLVIFLSLGTGWVGCTTTVKEQQSGQPVSEATGEKKTEQVLTGKYYLDDVRIPDELNYKGDESMVYETARFKAGVLRFSKWRLDVQSLIDYFTYNMEKDNWKLINTFKGQEIQLTFAKPEKTCNIRITESWTGMTRVMILVGPLGEKKM